MFPLKILGRIGRSRTVWGQPGGPTYKVATPDDTLSIHTALSRALGRLRHDSRPIALWTDGICINQQNEHEKSDQIRLMPRIPQKATYTLAMLGYDSRNDTAVEMLIRQRSTCFWVPNLRTGPRHHPSVPAAWEESGMPPMKDPI
ncbi:hypothetical protein QQZ08_007978 [Neonectria magnoliae]|uniref:Heterokaryon incompatibility domain-containing protein n=1 Tax=Neonectria magnoliae TaxID=2732573 RepID=A0ABR1HXL4_9HYPO